MTQKNASIFNAVTKYYSGPFIIRPCFKTNWSYVFNFLLLYVVYLVQHAPDIRSYPTLDNFMTAEGMVLKCRNNCKIYIAPAWAIDSLIQQILFDSIETTDVMQLMPLKTRLGNSTVYNSSLKLKAATHFIHQRVFRCLQQ